MSERPSQDSPEAVSDATEVSPEVTAGAHEGAEVDLEEVIDVALEENTELDLEEGKGPPEGGIVDVPALETIPPDDKVRAQVARALVAILAIVVFFSFLTMWMFSPPPKVQELEKLLTIIFGPLVALVSGAVGYYFGGKGDG